MFGLCIFWVASAYSSDAGMSSLKTPQSVEKDFSQQSNKYLLKIDPEIEEAQKQYHLAYSKNMEKYYLDDMERRKKEWEHRTSVLKWHFLSSIFIFLIIVIFILSGLYFSYLQFKASDYGRNHNASNSAQIEISRDGVKISSSVIGLLILFLSLSFFYLYLEEVYHLEIIQDVPSSKKPNSEKSEDSKQEKAESEKTDKT